MLHSLPACATSIWSNAVTSRSVSKKEQGHGVSASWPMPSTVMKDRDAPLALKSPTRGGVFFLFGGATVYGAATWLSIQSLFHCETRQLSRYPFQAGYTKTPTTLVFQNLEVETLCGAMVESTRS